MTPTQVVVSITGPDARTALAQAREAEAVGADLIEIRLDLMARLEDGLELLKERRLPVIATCRRAAEEGGFRGDEASRRKVLEAAVRTGAAWVDLERDVLAAGWKTAGAKVIGSFHDFRGIPVGAGALVRELLAGGADVAKVAGTPRTLGEARLLLDLNALTPGRVAAFGMGVRGVPTRILAGRFGAWGVYAASDIGASAAPGQVPLAELLFMYHFKEVGKDTALYGLLGSPVAQSPGAWAHTQAMRAAGIDGLYLALDAADPADARGALKAFSLRGASVTRPFKEALLASAGTRSGDVEATLAVNTLTRVEGAWEGANTDAVALRRQIGKRSRVAVAGAGGLAAAALSAAKGKTLGILARRQGPARDLAARFGAEVIPPEALRDFDVVIQATPAGGPEDPEGMPVPPEHLKPGALLIESPVFPLETPLARAARARGLRVVSGLELWLAQAREQFAIWHDRESALALLAPALAWLARLHRKAGSPETAHWTAALSGMRGAGKSTVGAMLAAGLERGFVDLDAEIARDAGLPVAEIFSEQGEEAFRGLETKALARVSLGVPGVLALGGGAHIRPENVALLSGFARTVFLVVPVGTLKARLAGQPGRPSLTGKGTGKDVVEELGAVWKAREEGYRGTAWAAVDADAAPEEVARRVRAALQNSL